MKWIANADWSKPVIFDQPGDYHWASGQQKTVPNCWTSLVANLGNYAAGMRFAVVFLAGRDSFIRARHCGAKFTAPQLVFKPQANPAFA